MAEITTEMQSAKKVSFTVAECGEFHNMGELHENVGSVKEALSLFEQIPGDRMHGIPTIGIRVTDVEHPEIFAEIDIANAKFIDLGMLDYVPEIAENKAAQFAIAELIQAMPDAIVKGEVPEAIQKKVQMLEPREKQADQLKEITDKLEQGVSDVFSSDKYKQFLDTMAKFPRYSVNNNILIMMQKSDAQMCQSFTGWKEMGRFVKEGEKGIKILAPAPYTIQREQTKLDDRGNPMMDKDGEPIMESVEIKVNAFKVVSTFDVSQTDNTKDDIEERILGKEEPERESDNSKKRWSRPKRDFDLLIDIQEKMKQGKGGGYTRWATVYNIKQMAQTLLFLQEKDIRSYDVLAEKASVHTARFNELSQNIKDAEKRLSELAVLKTHIINYAKTRDVYVAYRKSGYSKKFFEAHREEITLHKAAKEAFSGLPGQKIPKVKELNAEYAQVLAKKKFAYTEYRQAKKDMQDYVTAKHNIDAFLRVQENEQMHREEQKRRKQKDAR